MAGDSNTDKNSEKKQNSEDFPKDETVDKSKEELGNNNKKIENTHIDPHFSRRY